MATWFAAHNYTPADPNSIQAVVPFEGTYADLVTDDMCILYDSDNGFLRIYEYDSTSSATQDIPNIITSDGNAGNGRWLQREMSLDNRFFQGLMADKFSAVVTSDGATVTMTITNVEGGDLTLIHPSGRYTLTGGSTLALTPGSDSSPTENYVYVLESAPQTLAHSTSDWPTANHVKIAFFLLPSATEVQNHGAWINQNWNDGTRSDETGHLEHMAENMRLTMSGSVYHSGVDGNGSDDFIDITINGGANDNVFWKTTAGVSYQMHRHTIPAYDMGTGDDAHVVNWNGDAYHEITDLNEITADSTGASITNKYFNVVFWFANNKTGEYSPLMVNLPTGSYATLTNAVNDTDGHDVYDIPKAFNRESSTGMLVARITLRYTTAASGTWVVHNTTDLRGRTPGTASGTSLASQVEFPDNTFRIFDEADDTKELAFSVGGITTSTTRTITMPDADVDFDQLFFGNLTSIIATADGVNVRDTSGSASILKFENSSATALSRIYNSASDMSLQLYNGAAWEDAIKANLNGAAELYYDNVVAFQTNAGGIIVRDNSGANPDIRLRDDAGTEQGRITAGATNLYLQLWNGAAWEKGFHFDLSGSATVYYDDSVALMTDANGITIRDTSGDTPTIYFKNTAGDTVQGAIDVPSTDMTFYLGAAYETAIVANLNGAVELYYDDEQSLYTTAEGAVVKLTSGGVTASLSFRNASDTLEGKLLTTASTFQMKVGAAAETFLIARNNGATELYYNNVKALATTDAGVDVYDTSGSNPVILLKDDAGAPEARIYATNTTELFLQVYDKVSAYETAIKANLNGAVELYYDNVVAMFTTAEGINIQDTSGTVPAIVLASDAGTPHSRMIGNPTDFQIKVRSGAAWEDAFKAVVDGAVSLYYNNSVVLTTSGDGVAIRDTSGSSTVLYFRTDAGVNMAKITGATTNISLALYNGATWESSIIGTLNGAVELYYNNLKAFETTAEGIDLFDTSGDAATMYFKGDGGTPHAAVQSSTFNFNLINLNDEGHIRLRATNTASAEVAVLTGDPDADTKIYNSGNLVLSTGSTGINIFDTGGDNPALYGYEDDQSTLAFGVYSEGGNYTVLQDFRHGNDLYLLGENGSGTARGIHIDVSVPAVSPYSHNTHSCGQSGKTWVDVWAQNTTIQTSDRVRKRNFGPAVGLQFIDRLNPVKFEWVDGIRPHWGLIADEVKTALDDEGIDGGIYIDPLVEDPTRDPEVHTKGLRLGEMIPVLVKGVQELHAQSKVQNTRLNIQKTRIEDVEALAQTLYTQAQYLTEQNNIKTAQIQDLLDRVTALENPTT
jgi:hypothetical protein